MDPGFTKACLRPNPTFGDGYIIQVIHSRAASISHHPGLYTEMCQSNCCEFPAASSTTLQTFVCFNKLDVAALSSLAQALLESSASAPGSEILE